MAFEKITEQDSHHQDLEKKSLRELIEGMQQEDTAAVAALGKVLPEIEALIAQVVKAFEKGGRLFYMGAGTSGRLGVLDASECPPTFGTDPSQVVGLIAGGQKALTTAVEQAEDSTIQGWKDLETNEINSTDIVVGIAASGTTPYVVHALKSCQENGIVTGAICCNHNAPLSNYADYPIEVIVGPEFVTGSSRLKAGTVQKLILNRITTCSMIAIGRVQGNKMVDMQLNNDKLHERACQMVMTQTGLPHKEAKQLLQKYPSVRQAVAVFRSR
jgi:N-acetylmuramic acid 6-phosphate etherase